MLGLGNSISKSDFIQSASLLLDKSFAAGPAAAYSLRRVSSSYSGPAVQIRRASDNVEVNVNFDSDGVVSLNSTISNVTEETTGSSTSLTTSAKTLGQFVANASYTDADSLGSTDSALVQNWYDQSGNSNDAIQSTAANQPKIVSSGSLVAQNGKPAIEFDGSNDRLFSASTYTPTTSMAQIVVAKGTSSSTDQIIGDSNDRRHGMALRIQNGNFNYFNGIGSSFNHHTHTANDNQNLHFYGRDTSSTFYARLNGSETSTSISAIDTTALNIYLGARHDGSLNLDGTIQEYLLYLTSQSANKADIESEINTFYSIF